MNMTSSVATRMTRSAAILALMALGVAGCSNGQILVEEAGQSAQSEAVPNLDTPRIVQMLKDSQEVINTADQEQSSGILEARMSDSALRMRLAQYQAAKKTGKALPPLDLTEQTLSVTNSTDWPRVLLDVSKAPDGALPGAYFFVQSDARSGYKLQNWVRLLGGTEFTTLSVQEGAPYLQPEATGFTMTPQAAVQSYVDMLNSGTVGSDSVAPDEFSTKYLAVVKQLNESVTAVGSVTAAAAPIEGAPVTSVRLKDGSALVASAITYTHTYQRTVARSKMNLGGDPAVFAGDAAVIGTVKVNYLMNVLIHLPVEGSNAKAQLIGVETVLESVSKDDSTRPQGE